MATTAGKLELNPQYDNYDFPYISPNNQPGHPGYTTPQQDAQVFQLRTLLEQEGYKERLDTLTLLRFLRARKFDVQLAKKMYVDCEKWRSEFGGGVDQLVPSFEYAEKEKVFEIYPQYYHKTDKDGRPVYIEHLGKVDLTALQKVTTDERMLQNLVVEYEKLADPRLPACSRKSGFLLETSTTIIDAKGVYVTSIPSVYTYLQRTSAISQNYYPERLGKMYIINAPWGFSSAFGIVKKFLDPVTVAKIHILGSGYQTELLKQIPKENLPKSLGGSCDCPGGCHLSDQGPWQDPQWAKDPKWAAQKKEDQTLDATQSSSGVAEGTTSTTPADTGAATAEAGTTAGDKAPAAA